MHVDAVLVLRRLLGEIVGETEHAGEFVPGLRIEEGVPAAGVDDTVADADIRQAVGVIRPNRHVAGDVGHVVVDAGIPAQRGDRHQVAETPHRIADAVERENGKLPNGGTLSAPASVPASEVLTTPYDPRTPTVAWPPKTGVAKV